MKSQHTLSIALASDLHFEFHSDDPLWLPPLPDPADIDVMVLAGDIGVGQSALDGVFRIAEALTDTHIVWVAGNHEFYNHCIDTELQTFREACKDNPQVHYLENELVDISGWLFLGCTLWTGFNAMGEHLRDSAINKAQWVLPDFQIISKDQGTNRFTPFDAEQRFKESSLFLSNKLSAIDSKKSVVVTHFPPSRIMRHQTIPEGILSAYFQANCEALLNNHDVPLWIYGHNHWSDDRMISGTRVMSHQLGYPSESGFLPAFEPYQIVQLTGEPDQPEGARSCP